MTSDQQKSSVNRGGEPISASSEVDSDDNLTSPDQGSAIADEVSALWENRPFCQLLHATAEAIVVTDDRGRCVMANGAACALLGENQEALARLGLGDRLLGFNLEEVLQKIQPGQDEPIQASLVRADGTTIQVEGQITPHLMPQYHLWVLHDVTHKSPVRHSQHREPTDGSDRPSLWDSGDEALRHREKLLDLFFSQSLDGFFFLMLDQPIEWNEGVDQEAILDYVLTHGRVTLINDAMLAQYGATREQFLGRTLIDFFTHNLESGRSMLRQTLDQGHLRVEADERKMDGTPFITDGYYVCMYDDKGCITGLFGVQHDVTERKQLELMLQRSQAELSEILNRAIAGILRGQLYPDLSMQFDYISPHYEKLWGLSAEALIRDCNIWRSRIHPEDWSQVVLPNIQTVMAQRGVWTYEMEYRFRRDQENWVWVLANCHTEWDDRMGGWHITIVDADITTRKRAELALKESEARFWELSEASPANIYILVRRVDGSLYFEHVSRVAESILEIPVEQMLADASLALDRIHPGDRAAYEAATQRSVETLQPFFHQWRMVTPSGGVKWLQGSSRPKARDNGEIAWYGVLLDITDRKAAELALERESQRRQTLVNASFDGIVVVDSQGGVIEANHSFAAMLGYSLEEVTRLKVTDWDAQMTPEELAACREASMPTFTFETRHRCKDGHVIDVEICCNRVEWEGEVIRFCVCRDISDRKQLEAERQAAEALIRQRQEEFRALAENAPDAIIRCDRHFRFLYANPVFTTITGIPRSNFLGKTIQELDLSEDLVSCWRDAIEQIWITGENQFLRHDFRTVQGTTNFYDIRFAPEFALDGSVVSVLGICRDITELKTAQDSLRCQAEREHSLRLITQHIRETLDLDDVLATAVTEIQRILQADRTLIFRFDSPCSGVVIQEAVRPEYPTILNMQWKDPHFPLEYYAAYCQGDTQIVSDRTSDQAKDQFNPYLSVLMQQFKFCSKIVAPITQSQNGEAPVLWGLLVVHACGKPRHWHPDEADLLQQVADQLAIAIHQAELYHQVQQLNTNLEQQVQERTTDLQQALEFEQLLRRITDQVRDSLDEHQILATAVRELAQGLQLECCDTGIYNADRTTSTIAYECNISLQPALGSSFAIAESPYTGIYASLFQGQACQVCNIVFNVLRRDQQLMTILACPIRDERDNLGDIWLFKQPGEVFHGPEVRLVQQVANQCAIALRQSRLYQAAQAQVQELERLNHLKDDFLSTVSHELRTPMSNIKMAIQMLEMSLNSLGVLTDGSTSVARYFHVLREEGQRETALINDLLDLTRLDAETEPLEATKISLQFYLPHIAELFADRMDQQQQHLILQIPDNLPPLTTHLPYLERILAELLNNACKYTPAGETITVSAQASATTVELDCSNSGVEIPVTERDRIFDKFYRIPSHDPWKHGGTGLGLALVTRMLKRLGGTITVASPAQPGTTTFTVGLPLEMLEMVQ